MQDRETRVWRARVRWIVNHYETAEKESDRRKKAAERLKVTVEGMRLLWIGKSIPERDTLISIVTAYPRVNPGWLLTGKGPRERTDNDPEADDYTAGIRAALAAGVRSLVELEERLTGEATLCRTTPTGNGGPAQDVETEKVPGTKDRPANDQ